MQERAGVLTEGGKRARQERVLVVEDNDELRRLVVRQLGDLGYVVLEADSGKLALSVLAAGAVDLLFTDVIMPGGMSGAELAKAARLETPDLKVVFTTGFTGAAADASGIAAGDDLLLTKPYRKADLALTLRQALEAA